MSIARRCGMNCAALDAGVLVSLQCGWTLRASSSGRSMTFEAASMGSTRVVRSGWKRPHRRTHP